MTKPPTRNHTKLLRINFIDLMKPNLREEKKLWKQGYEWVVGIDEAGIGSLAGPVVAGAILLLKSKIQNPKSKMKSKNSKLFTQLRDSKKLSAKQRERFYKILTTHPDIYWGVGVVSPKIIDRIDILNASRLAMKKALSALEKDILNESRLKSRFKSIDFIILDGRGRLDVPVPQKAIVKADERVFSCAAASIIAKVTRDRIMMGLHKKYPQYRFDKHKGYPTKVHIKALKRYGVTGLHRKSFGPARGSKIIWA